MFEFLKKFLSIGKQPLPQEADTIIPSRDDAPRIFARLFSSDDGKLAMSYLRATVNARVSGPEAGEGHLRYQDGQRGLLQTINALVEQGKN